MAAIPITERKYVLAEKKDETPEVLILKFTPEDGQPTFFDPGMFMMITGIDSAGKRYTGRAFSIASDPSSPGMEFMVIKEPTHGDHIGKSHFVDANIGDIFFLKGPNGQFRFDPSVDKKVLFLAGGTGLAPFISMLRHIRSTNSQSDVVLLYSTKFPTEVILKEELNSYVNDLHTKLVVTVTRPQPGDGWTGQTGHIDANMIKNYAADCNERTPYICGPLAFVKAVKDALISLGIPNEKIKADVWG
jgi:Na+-transporting NADH:ubiquinone oxidoreductase subunit F